MSITDGGTAQNLNLSSALALALKDIDIGGDLHVTTKSTGVTQAAGSLRIGGTTTFTADTGTTQDAVLTTANNHLVGKVTFDQTNSGSWRNVSLTSDTALSLGPLQSGGAVLLDAQGPVTTDSNMSVSNNLSITTHGGALALGSTTVSGAVALDTSIRDVHGVATGIIDNYPVRSPRGRGAGIRRHRHRQWRPAPLPQGGALWHDGDLRQRQPDLHLRLRHQRRFVDHRRQQPQLQLIQSLDYPSNQKTRRGGFFVDGYLR